jgi:hypothetical protein
MRVKRTQSLVAMAGLMLSLASIDCSNEPSADDFVNEYPEAYCDYIFRCCDAVERSYGSKVTCQSAKTAEVDELLAFRDADGVHAGFLSDAAKSCLDDLKSADCSVATGARSCLDRVTAGKQQPGGECSYSAECISYYCVQPEKHAKGTCGAAAGGSCSGDDRACQGAAFCDTSLQCLPKKAPGLMCTRGAECMSGVCSPQSKSCSGVTDPFCDGK